MLNYANPEAKYVQGNRQHVCSKHLALLKPALTPLDEVSDIHSSQQQEPCVPVRETEPVKAEDGSLWRNYERVPCDQPAEYTVHTNYLVLEEGLVQGITQPVVVTATAEPVSDSAIGHVVDEIVEPPVVAEETTEEAQPVSLSEEGEGGGQISVSHEGDNRGGAS